MPDLHTRIAERAFFAWQAGVPGCDVDHWLAAEERETFPTAHLIAGYAPQLAATPPLKSSSGLLARLTRMAAR